MSDFSLSKLVELLSEGHLDLGPYRLAWSIQRKRPTAGIQTSTTNWSDGPYKLHLGPGAEWTKPGSEWLAVDVDPERADLMMDLNAFDRFPLPAGSVVCIYGSHVFEHVNIWTSQSVFNECYRILRPGGYLRVVLPDVRRSIEAYLADDWGYELFRRRRRRAEDVWGITDYTLFDCLREDFLSKSLQSELLGPRALAHQNAWDFESLHRSLQGAGFRTGEVFLIN